MGSDQGRWGNIQGISRQHQVGFVIRQELQNRSHDRPVGEVITQHFWRQAGQRQQPFCPRLLAQNPRQRRQSE